MKESRNFIFKTTLVTRLFKDMFPAKEGSKLEKEDLKSKKNRFLRRWQLCNKTRERLLIVTFRTGN